MALVSGGNGFLPFVGRGVGSQGNSGKGMVLKFGTAANLLH
ncbi:hypothetical protein [Leptolyngbya sp. FACHB-711]|nr:hypothetical protein [Leptolyngbya sp. FACHB-711]